MIIKLYHFTDRVAARKILRSGFRPGDDGLIWFGEHPCEIWGASATSALLEIQVEESSIQSYQQTTETLENWDPKLRQWIPSDSEPRYTYYAFPPEAVAGISTRLLSRKMLRAMMV